MFNVIFDMDGTLLDTQQITIPAWDWAGERQGFSNMGRCIPDVCGKNEAGWSAYLRENFPTLDVKTFNKDARDYVAEHLVIKYKTGAEELARFLKSKGVRIAIASGSSPEIIKHHLEQLNGLDLFEVMVGGADVKNGKPAPDIFLLAAEKLSVNPADCYVIEDSENGIKAANSAGMKSIGIPDIVEFNNETKALLTAEFSSMNEALEYFKKIIEE